jgi:hypothetical protein
MKCRRLGGSLTELWRICLPMFSASRCKEGGGRSAGFEFVGGENVCLILSYLLLFSPLLLRRDPHPRHSGWVGACLWSRNWHNELSLNTKPKVVRCSGVPVQIIDSRNPWGKEMNARIPWRHVDNQLSAPFGLWLFFAHDTARVAFEEL